MWDFLFALLIHSFLKNLPKKRKEIEYVPRFLGHWVNMGDEYDERWIYKTPKFRTRYVNLTQLDGILYIKLSWNPDSNNIEVFREKDPRGADKTMEWLSDMFPEAIIDTNEIIYINVYFEDELIKLERSNNPSEKAIEIVKVLDEDEFDDVLEKMKIHFQKYTSVIELISKY